MPAPTRPHPLIFATLLVASVGALAGCQAPAVAAHASFSSRAAAELDWPLGDGIPAWVPAEVRMLHVRGIDGAGDAIVYADTAAPLPDGVCAEAPRTTTPAITAAWSPKWAEPPETVWTCGAWEIAAVPNGWFGWATHDARGEAQR